MVVLSKSLEFWKTAFNFQKRLMEEAKHAHYYFLVKRSLIKWHTTCMKIRERKTQQLFDHYMQRKDLRLIRSCFTCWRDRLSDCIDIGRVAEDIVLQKNGDIIERSFTHWKQLFHAFTSQQVEADNKYRSRLILY